VVVFGFVEFVAGFGGFGWIDHHFYDALAYHGGAELDGDEFVDLCAYLCRYCQY